MRHLCYIRYDYLTSDILTNCKCNVGLKLLEGIVVDKITEVYNLIICIRNFYSDSSLTRNRSFYSDICCCKIKLNIICQRYDLCNLNTLFRLKLISCNGRTAAVICNGYIYTEACQCFLETFCCLSDILIVLIISRSST